MSKIFDALRQSSMVASRSAVEPQRISQPQRNASSYDYTLDSGKIETIKSAINSQHKRRRADCIGLMSAPGAQGASVICRDYAVSEAATGLKTLLVDADINHRKLTSYFSADPSQQTSSPHYTDEWHQSVFINVTSNMDFVSVIEAPTELSLSSDFDINQSKIDEIKKVYDLGVFSLGQYSNDDNHLNIAKALDCVFIIGQSFDDEIIETVGKNLLSFGIIVKGAIMYG